MSLLFVLVVGGMIGWLASVVMRTDDGQGVLLDVMVGIVGALIAGILLTPVLGGAPITSGSFDLLSLVVSLLGAAMLLSIISMFRRSLLR